MENFTKINKISIPDEDAIKWIETLRNAGFSQEELDLVMNNLNETYADKNDPKYAYIKEELIKIEEKIREGQGRELDETEKEYFIKSIKSRDEYKKI